MKNKSNEPKSEGRRDRLAGDKVILKSRGLVNEKQELRADIE